MVQTFIGQSAWPVVAPSTSPVTHLIIPITTQEAGAHVNLTLLEESGSPNVSPPRVATASLGTRLEMPVASPHPLPPDSETLQVGFSSLCFGKPLVDSNECTCLRTMAVGKLKCRQVKQDAHCYSETRWQKGDRTQAVRLRIPTLNLLAERNGKSLTLLCTELFAL